MEKWSFLQSWREVLPLTGVTLVMGWLDQVLSSLAIALVDGVTRHHDVIVS